MNFLLSVGLRIRELRYNNNMTQEELALKVGYTSRSSINKIEKGMVDLPQSKIAEIADALDTTPGYLMGWDDSSADDQAQLPAETSAPTVSPNRQKLIDLAMSVSEDKVEPLYQALQAILAIQK
jgi:transcriptional regulator with XRE-family HTH domain